MAESGDDETETNQRRPIYPQALFHPEINLSDPEFLRSLGEALHEKWRWSGMPDGIQWDKGAKEKTMCVLFFF